MDADRLAAGRGHGVAVTGPPPDALARRLVGGGSGIAAVEWHPVVDSTNTVAAAAAVRGADEITVVVADTQTAGRGRHGRVWHAPPGASLLVSLLVRPVVPPAAVSLLPLVAGLALAETVDG
ncbi:MAG: biotin--[acetyl-CoA-carboxylase] ligase, partial [Actinomycetota bacterium]|nr:biotin--[acetyl-CoA-carboxylase] ligase [Actinomycetota bacterium]